MDKFPEEATLPTPRKNSYSGKIALRSVTHHSYFFESIIVLPVTSHLINDDIPVFLGRWLKKSVFKGTGITIRTRVYTTQYKYLCDFGVKMYPFEEDQSNGTTKYKLKYFITNEKRHAKHWITSYDQLKGFLLI